MPELEEQAFTMFRQQGLLIAAYGGAYQYGSPLYDMTALFASRVVGGPVPNQPFYDGYRAMVAHNPCP